MQRIISTLKPITPLELYTQRVNSTYTAIRAANSGFDYTPAQFGGIFGQTKVLADNLVLDVIDFEVS